VNETQTTITPAYLEACRPYLEELLIGGGIDMLETMVEISSMCATKEELVSLMRVILAAEKLKLAEMEAQR
jgi:hypothetical protein